MLLFENANTAEAIKPQTMAGAQSGDWVSLKGYNRCMIVVHIAQGAVNTTALTVDKACTVAGGANSDGITMNNWWGCADTPTTANTFTKGTAAASITTSATGSGSSIYIIDIKADELPSAGTQYDCIQLEAGASSASNLLSAMYILYEPRYSQAATPTAITD